jgi:phage shock protein A
MPLMSAELYDALLEAGTSEATARKAAEAVASHDQRFASLESKLDTRFASLEGKFDTRLASVEGKIETVRAQLTGEMAWVKWMLGTNLVVTLGVLWKILKP